MLYYVCLALGIAPEKLPRMRFVELTYDGIVKAFEDALNGRSKLHMGMAMAGHYRHLLDLWFGKNISHLFSEGAKKYGASNQIRFYLGRVKVPLLTKLSSKKRRFMKEPESRISEGSVKTLHEKPKYIVSVKVDYYGLTEAISFRVSPEEIPAYFKDKWSARVVDVFREEREKTPRREVFNTSEIVNEASMYGVSTKKIMDILQFLYQIGCISYPRTPSKKLPRELETHKIIERLSQKIKWIDPNDFLDLKDLTELQSRPEDPHAGIYPIDVPPKELPDDYLLVWELIARKFLVALAKPCKLRVATAVIELQRNGIPVCRFSTEFSEDIYWGFKKYSYRETYSSSIIPEIKVGDEAEVILTIETEEVHGGFTGIKEIDVRVEKLRRIPISGVDGLLSWMEQVKLGTEATRSEHINEILEKGYVSGGEELILTAIGQKVADLCREHIPLTLEDTDRMYRVMEKLLSNHQNIEELLEEAKKKIIEIYKTVDMDEIGRKLNNIGVCPLCKNRVRLVFFNNRYYAGCSKYPECKYLLSLSD